MNFFKETIHLVCTYHTLPHINQFWTLNLSCNEITCKSQKLLLKHGLIQISSSGIYHILPPLVKALDKLIKIIDEEMKNIGGEKLMLPCLTPGRLWKLSGRWEKIGEELYKLKDRNNIELCLGPTHEEAITDLISRHHTTLSYKLFPMRLYQISTKFRDEMRPRFGLLRGKEFIMKDMYTFDVSEKGARETYNQVCKAYENIFTKLGIAPIKVEGTFGCIGGSITHEFHCIADIGEDEIFFCNKCNIGRNIEICSKTLCENCGNEMKKFKGIEVAQAFFLGEIYTKPFKLSYKSDKGTMKLLQMGCFGLGVSRIIGACLEILSSENALKWPLKIAPSLVCVITPKAGSKEESMMQFAYDISTSLNQLEHLKDNVIIDKRTKLTIGSRFNNAKEIGLPYIVVIGKKATELIPKIEVHDIYHEKVMILTHAETIEFFRNIVNIL